VPTEIYDSQILFLLLLEHYDHNPEQFLYHHKHCHERFWLFISQMQFL